MKIILGSDHRGFKMKEEIKEYLTLRKIPYEDLGAFLYEKEDDYTDYAEIVARKVSKNKNYKGVLICGSGVGVSIVANKIINIRAVNAWGAKVARLSRQDDDTNILCLPAIFLTMQQSKKILSIWLKTSFSKAIRHNRRVAKIKKIERNN